MNNQALHTINSSKFLITYDQKITLAYTELTQVPRDEEDFIRPENKTVINPIAGKMLFGKNSSWDLESIAFIKDSVSDYEKTITELFMFVDLKMFAELYGASRVKRDIAIGRGDFDFLGEFVEGMNTRSVYEVEDFAECVWFDGQAAEEFIRPFRDLKSRITKLKQFYAMQDKSKKRYCALR